MKKEEEKSSLFLACSFIHVNNVKHFEQTIDLITFFSIQTAKCFNCDDFNQQSNSENALREIQLYSAVTIAVLSLLLLWCHSQPKVVCRQLMQ
jgi:hypothetical protein